MTAEAWLWPAGLGLLGLILGSFIATIAIRWPEERSVAQGRSQCDFCHKVLTPGELVPVVSYLVQRGRCRGCGARIAPLHLVVELLGCAVGVTAGLVWPDSIAAAIFGWLLLTLAAIDFRAYWLPNTLTAALALCGLLFGIAPIEDRLIGGVAGFAALWLVAAGYRHLRGRDGLGGGDPKLFGAIGLWLGWQHLPTVLLLACAIGLAIVIVGYARGRELRGDDRLPLGTLLAPAAYFMWLLVSAAANISFGI